MRGFLKNEDGAVVVIIALVMTVLMAMAALTIDIGYAYVVASETQNTADAACLSVYEFLPVGIWDTKCKNQIIERIIEYGKKNGVDNIESNDIIFGNDRDGYYYSVSVYVNKEVETNLARVIGVENIKVKKKATASALPAGGVIGAVPIGVNKGTFENSKGSNDSVTLKFGGGDGVNGYYGYMVLDGANGNSYILEKWLKYGYPGENYVGQVLPTASGNKASVAKDGVQYRMSLCTHYKTDGGCTKQHYVESCPRIMNVLIYDLIDSDKVKIIGFAPFILEYADEADVIKGAYLKMPVQQNNGTVGDEDFGGYVLKLTE
ncbi:MAG: Tad domain-containing protein [Eubacteriales bacterium]|nr:Tad domain-containing protein [Eubacteriales bacterium]